MPAVKEGRETLQRRQLHLPDFPLSENGGGDILAAEEQPTLVHVEKSTWFERNVETFASDGHMLSKKIICGQAKLLWVLYGTHVFAPIPLSLFSFFPSSLLQFPFRIRVTCSPASTYVPWGGNNSR